MAKLAILIAIVILAVGVKAIVTKKPTKDAMPAYAATSDNDSQTANNSSTDTTPAASTDTGTSTPAASTYKDGTYTATGSYESPGGNESITITVSIKGDTVTSSSAKSGANDNDAEQFQADFISGYKSQVVGKSVASIHLSRVSGSSLTSQGFNDALDKIKTQAKA